MQQENETGKVASNLMSLFINAGVVEHTDDEGFVVKGNGGASKFKPFEGE